MFNSWKVVMSGNLLFPEVLDICVCVCVCVMEGKCTEFQGCKSNTRPLKRKAGMSNLHLHRQKHNWMVVVVVLRVW